MCTREPGFAWLLTRDPEASPITRDPASFSRCLETVSTGLEHHRAAPRRLTLSTSSNPQTLLEALQISVTLVLGCPTLRQFREAGYIKDQGRSKLSQSFADPIDAIREQVP